MVIIECRDPMHILKIFTLKEKLTVEIVPASKKSINKIFHLKICDAYSFNY